jgi:large subunit ribosomal protein L29
MQADEMRGMSDDELGSRVAELERERFNLRFKSGTQPLEDPLRLRAIRKDLARLKTIQRERALGVTRPVKAEVAAPAKSGRRASARRAR